MCFILFPLEVPNWSPLPPECSDWEILLEEKGFLFTFPRVLPCLTSLPGEDVSTDPRLSNPVEVFPLLSLVALQHCYSPALPQVHSQKSSPSLPSDHQGATQAFFWGSEACVQRENMLVFMKKCKYVYVCVWQLTTHYLVWHWTGAGQSNSSRNPPVSGAQHWGTKGGMPYLDVT